MSVLFACLLTMGVDFGWLQVRLWAEPDGLDAVDANQGTQFSEVLRGIKGQSDSLTAHSGGASCPMCVGFGVGGEIVVDHVGGVGEIETSAGDVGGDHIADVKPVETAEKTGASGLVESPVNDFDGVEFFFEMIV